MRARVAIEFAVGAAVIAGSSASMAAQLDAKWLAKSANHSPVWPRIMLLKKDGSWGSRVERQARFTEVIVVEDLGEEGL